MSKIRYTRNSCSKLGVEVKDALESENVGRATAILPTVAFFMPFWKNYKLKNI